VAVEAELKRRKAEIAAAKASGKKRFPTTLEVRYEGAEITVLETEAERPGGSREMARTR
jgi:hypothetical protein